MLYEVVLELGWGQSRYFVNALSPEEILEAAQEAGLKILEVTPFIDKGPKSWPHPDDVFEDPCAWRAYVLQDS